MKFWFNWIVVFLSSNIKIEVNKYRIKQVGSWIHSYSWPMYVHTWSIFRFRRKPHESWKASQCSRAFHWQHWFSWPLLLIPQSRPQAKKGKRHNTHAKGKTAEREDPARASLSIKWISASLSLARFLVPLAFFVKLANGDGAFAHSFRFGGRKKEGKIFRRRWIEREGKSRLFIDHQEENRGSPRRKSVIGCGVGCFKVCWFDPFSMMEFLREKFRKKKFSILFSSGWILFDSFPQRIVWILCRARFPSLQLVLICDFLGHFRRRARLSETLSFVSELPEQYRSTESVRSVDFFSVGFLWQTW